MDDQNRAGWYALYLSITQNITPARAISTMEGRRRGGRPLSWEQFVAAYHAGEQKIRSQRLRRNRSEKVREYQREYRRSHPLTSEQRERRRQYMKAYRDANRPGRSSRLGQRTPAPGTGD